MTMQIKSEKMDRLKQAGTQARFAIALALTKTAQKAQGEVRKHIDEGICGTEEKKWLC